MRLKEALADLPDVEPAGNCSAEILGIAYDSRQVQPGFLFVAIRGEKTDGNAVDVVLRAPGLNRADAISAHERISVTPKRMQIRTPNGRRRRHNRYRCCGIVVAGPPACLAVT